MCALAAALVIFSNGCNRDGVKVYHVENEDAITPPPPPAAAPAAMPTTMPAGLPVPDGSTLPQLKYTLPDGWAEKTPGQMRVASFSVTATNGEVADVGVIPLPATGQEIQLVNMWRGQLQLSAATNDDSAAVAIGSDSGKLFDIASDAPMIDGKLRARILVAMLTRGATSWFFKMTGEESFVESEKPAFLQFLKSVNFVVNSAPMQSAVAPTASDDSGKPVWMVPPDWQQVDPGVMLLAKFSIGSGDAKADVNVSALAGEGGGLLANVNRWRHLQLGLEEVDQTSLEKLVSTFDANGNQASLVDFTGTDSKTGKSARLIGVVVPLAEQTWFYKLMGDPDIVAQQKDAFVKFVQSAKYPDAH